MSSDVGDARTAAVVGKNHDAEAFLRIVSCERFVSECAAIVPDGFASPLFAHEPPEPHLIVVTDITTVLQHCGYRWSKRRLDHSEICGKKSEHVVRGRSKSAGTVKGRQIPTRRRRHPIEIGVSDGKAGLLARIEDTGGAGHPDWSQYAFTNQSVVVHAGTALQREAENGDAKIRVFESRTNVARQFVPRKERVQFFFGIHCVRVIGTLL